MGFEICFDSVTLSTASSEWFGHVYGKVFLKLSLIFVPLFETAQYPVRLNPLATAARLNQAASKTAPGLTYLLRDLVPTAAWGCGELLVLDFKIRFL